MMSSPEKTMTMIPNDSLASRLTQIGLKSMAQSLDDFIARATKARWSPHVLLEQLHKIESDERARLSLEYRLRFSGIGRFKLMADFNWDWPTKIERELIEQALTLDFLQESRNLILLGRNGLGKTMIAKNIAYAAVMAGYSVLFRTAADIIEHLQCDSPQLRRRRINAYSKPHLLCIDELAYLSYDDNAADLLYEVINRRYEKRSVIITTNRTFKEWNQVFPNATCIATLLDRLTHHADVTVFEGESYRLHESEQESAARRKKRK
jgi:DNA replication protein DnaC